MPRAPCAPTTLAAVRGYRRQLRQSFDARPPARLLLSRKASNTLALHHAPFHDHCRVSRTELLVRVCRRHRAHEAGTFAAGEPRHSQVGAEGMLHWTLVLSHAVHGAFGRVKDAVRPNE